MSSRPNLSPGSRALVASHEGSVDAVERRRRGVHYTPPEVARPVIELAVAALGGPPRTVCDPACGGGAFLLSVAQHLFDHGVPADEIVRTRLAGMELDPVAVGVARSALSRWAAEHGADVGADDVQVHQGDALAVGVERWPARPRAGFDLVVGNPPFLSQLSRSTARNSDRRRRVTSRLGPVAAYADDAGLFLLAAVDLVAPGGVVAMVQPQSLLSARDADLVRAGLLERCDLAALWAHGGSPFPDADVHVCAPVLRRVVDPGSTAEGPGVEVVWATRDDEHRCVAARPAPGATWGALLGPALGVPETPALTGPPLGTVATATAGFRDEYYALCAALAEPGVGRPGDAAGCPRLVTVGTIDPGWLRWGVAGHWAGGRQVATPRVDLGRLQVDDPRVARWARARLRPKVLVASQTKVVEAVVDPVGDCVPLTPTISVEPSDDSVDVWHLMAALSAPPIAAAVLRERLGAGRSTGTLRWSARGVLEMPLPTDGVAWHEGAQLARSIHLDEHGHPLDVGTSRTVERRGSLLDRLGATMTRAYGMPEDHPVTTWWSGRLPRR